HVTLTLSAQLGIQDNGGPKLSLLVHGDDNITLLSGSLSVFAEFGILSWKKRFDHEFFNWTGFKNQGVLFNVSRQPALPGPSGKGSAKTPPKTPAKAPAKGH